MGYRTDAGVPLPEILFALLILGLVTAVAIPPMVYSSDTQSAECNANIDLLNRKIERYVAEHHGWTPASQADFEKMVSEDGKVPGAMPKCPFGEPYAYDPATGRLVPHRH